MQGVDGVVLLDIGCAECRGWSSTEGLVREVLHFPTVEAAQAHVQATRGRKAQWSRHPLGGVFDGASDGDLWIAPAALFSAAQNAG